MPSLGSTPVIVSEYLTDTVARSWRERLWSWPWRPWVRTKSQPSMTAYQLPNGTLIVSPAMWQAMKREVDHA